MLSPLAASGYGDAARRVCRADAAKESATATPRQRQRAMRRAT